MNVKFARIRPLLPFGIALLLLLLAIWEAVFPQLPLVETQLRKIHAQNQALAQTINDTVAAHKLKLTDLAPLMQLRQQSMSLPEQTCMVVMRERIEGAAGQAQLGNRTLGTIRKVAVTDEVALYEVSFSGEGPIAGVVNFLTKLDAENPRLFWRTLSLQPSANGLLAISGTLGGLSFSGSVAAPAAESVPAPEAVAAPAAPAPEATPATPAEGAK